ncbi:MAG: hypothetical protein AAGF33_17765 [Pseudomonadota bacterium]
MMIVYASKLTPSFACIAMIISACASAEGPKPVSDQRSTLEGKQVSPPIGLVLASMDSNGDATLSPAELEAGYELSFASGDLDDSRALSGTEFTKWSETQLGQTYALPSLMNFDHDQNASVSETEFKRTFAEIVARFDANADGVLVRSELITTLSLPGLNPDQMRREMEAEMRKKMEEAMRRRRAGGAG